MGAVKDILKKRAKNRVRLEKEAPMAVALSVATRCVPCLASHATNAIEAGASREEVVEAAAIGVEFGGGPSFVVVRDNLLDFLDEIEASRKSSRGS